MKQCNQVSQLIVKLLKIFIIIIFLICIAQVEVLDPVFYRNDARMQMFRDSPVGKIRQQQKTKEVNSECLYPPLPNEFSGSNQTSNGILLTSKHPGQDMMNMSISMMTTSEADFN